MDFDPYIWLALSPIAGLAADCAAHILLVRLTGGAQAKRYICVLAAFALGLVALLATTAAGLWAIQASVGDTVALVLMNGAAYVGLGYGYMCFVNMNLTSLRIRILHEILAAGGKMPKATLAAIYNTEQMIRVRFGRLVEGGNIVPRGDRYVSGKATLLYIAAAVDFMRIIVFGTKNPRK